MSKYIMTNNNGIPDLSLYEKYRERLERLYRGSREVHCKEYEELTMEEKLLVDIDMEYLKDEYDILRAPALLREDLERCLSKLRKRDRENGKRNGR